MVTTREQLEVLYPFARWPADFRITDDGANGLITFWNTTTLGAQPSQATLDAVTAGQLADARERRSIGVVGTRLVKRLTADAGTTLNSYQSVTALGFQLKAGLHYAFDFRGAYTAAVNTTGIQLAFNGPAFTVFGAAFEIFTSTTAKLAAAAGAYDVGVNGTGSAGATALPFWCHGTVSPSADGLFVLRGRSEVNGSAVTIKATSYATLDVVA